MVKMGNALGTANEPKLKLPLKSETGKVHRGDALPGSIVHEHTAPAGAVPPRRGSGNQVSGIDTALSQHADVLHPTGSTYNTGYVKTAAAGATPRMAVEPTHDRKKSGGY